MAQPFDHYNIYTDSTTPIGFRLAPVFKVDEKKKVYVHYWAKSEYKTSHKEHCHDI